MNQLMGGSCKTDVTNAVLEQVANRYDNLGNRRTKQVDASVFSGTFNNLNQLTDLAFGGKMTCEGTLDEPAMVTVGGIPATVSGSNEFRAEAAVTTGTIPIVATDASSNSRTKHAIVVVPSGSSRSFTYDSNGNLSADGEKTYEWDAQDRLIAINYSRTSNRTEIGYDGFGRRNRIVEKTSGTTTLDVRDLWDALRLAEERDSSGATTQKQYFAQGFKAGAAKYYYAKDHLGSVCGLVDASGVVRGLWSYDLWGKRGANQMTTGVVDSDVAFTGHFLHGRSSLVVVPFRFYDPVTARWLWRDPIGEEGGVNFYAYVSNKPVNAVDLTGMAIIENNTSGPVLVSGNLGANHGAGNQVYGSLSPGQTGGGAGNPVPAYNTPSEARNAANPDFVGPHNQVGTISDVDAVGEFSEDCPIGALLSNKAFGDEFGPTIDLGRDSAGNLLGIAIMYDVTKAVIRRGVEELGREIQMKMDSIGQEIETRMGQ